MNIKKYGVFWLFLIMVNLPVVGWAQLPVVNLTLDDGDAAEAGQDPGSFTVTRSNTGDVGASLVTRIVLELPESATLDTDYRVSGGVSFQDPNILELTIPANQLSMQLVLTPVRDNLVEGPETVGVTLETDGTDYDLGIDTQATITIADDPVEVNLTLDDGDADEAGQDPGSFTVTRSNTGNVDDFILIRVAVDLAGSATVNTDYTGNGWGFVESPNIYRVTILGGQLSAQVVLPPARDNLVEGQETFAVALVTDGTIYTLGTDTQASFTIADDPVEVNLTLNDGDAAEAGPDPGSFTVSRSDAGLISSSFLVRVELNEVSTASQFADFTTPDWLFVQDPNIFQVSIPANQLSKTVVITPVTDMNEEEGDETLDVSVIENNEIFLLGPNINALINIANLINSVFEDSFEEPVPGN